MVRKVSIALLTLAIMLSALCAPTFAATHTVYNDGNLGTTYVTYFKDIVSHKSLTDNYVAFRSGQYEYTLIVGDLKKEGSQVILEGTGKEYTFTTTGTYNSQYQYKVNEISTFSVETGTSIIYSDVGDYPQLIERSTEVETLTLIAIIAVCVYGVAWGIFRHSLR